MPPVRARHVVAALVTAIGAAVSLALVPPPSLPPFLPVGDYPAYAGGDDAPAVLIAPVLHAPWVGTVPVAVGALVAGAAAAAAVLAAAVLGAEPLAAVLVTAAFLAAGDARGALGHAAPAALALIAFWGWLCAAGRVPVLALGTWAAAVVLWLPLAAFGLAPAVATAGRVARGRAVAWSLGTIAATSLFAWVSASWLGGLLAELTLPPLAMPGSQVLAVALDRAPRGTTPFAPPGAGSLPPAMFAGLAVAGLAFGGAPRRLRLGLAAGVAGAAIASVTWPAWSEALRREAGWTLVPLAAAGLTWIARQAPRPTLVTGALGLVLLAGTVSASRRPIPMLEPVAFSAALADALRAVPADAVMVAEDTRVDSALVAWGGGRVPGAGLVRTSQEPDLAAVVASARPVVAAPTGRAALELLGVRFRTAAVVEAPAPFSLHVATSQLACAKVDGTKWSPLPGLEYTGRLGLTVPAWRGARLDLVVGDAPPFRLQLETAAHRPLPMAVLPLQNGPGLDAPPPDYWLEEDDPFAAPARVLRASVPAPVHRPAVYGLDLGRRAPRVLARMIDAPASLAARVCAAPLGPDDWFADGEGSSRAVPLGEQPYFGAGWHGLEREGARPYRWTARESVLLVPSARGGAVTIGLTGRPAVSPTADLTVRVTPTVNGRALMPQAMEAGERTYAWTVPAGAWVAGTNEIQWSVSQAVRPADRGAGDTRVLGMLVYAVTVKMGE